MTAHYNNITISGMGRMIVTSCGTGMTPPLGVEYIYNVFLRDTRLRT